MSIDDSLLLLAEPSLLKARIGATVNIRRSSKKGQRSDGSSGIVVSIDPISKSYVITNPEGTELTLIPRLEEDEVEVVKPPSEESVSLVERVFQKLASNSSSSDHKVTTGHFVVTAVTSDQLATSHKNKGRLLEALTSRRIAVSDEGDRIVVEGGAATVRAPFASPADCRSSNTVVLERIRRLMEEM